MFARWKISIVFAFGACGVLVGWMTGASSTPVVGVVLPLVFGLIGAFTYTVVDRHARNKAILEQFEDLDEEIVSDIRSILNSSQYSEPTLWGVSITVFCVACMGGAIFGSQLRSAPNYADLDQLLTVSKVEIGKLAAADRSKLLNLSWRLRAMGLKPTEVQKVFNVAIAPAVESQETVNARNAKRSKDLENIAKFVDEMKTKGTNAASVDQLVKLLKSSILIPNEEPDPLHTTVAALLSGVPSVNPKYVTLTDSAFFMNMPNHLLEKETQEPDAKQ